MKKWKCLIIYPIIFFLGSCYLSSCSNTEDALFVYSQEVFFDIPAGLNTIETHFFRLFDVPSDLALQLENRGFTTDDFDRVMSNQGIITARFNQLNWNIVERVIVNVLDKDDPNVVTEIFYRDFVPLDTGEEVQLLANISNLKDILLEETIDLEFRIDFRAFPTANIETQFFFSFAVINGE